MHWIGPSEPGPLGVANPPPLDLFDPTESEQAITTATAVLAWVEQLDQEEGRRCRRRRITMRLRQ